jgi:hypothetical protein
MELCCNDLGGVAEIELAMEGKAAGEWGGGSSRGVVVCLFVHKICSNLGVRYGMVEFR